MLAPASGAVSFSSLARQQLCVYVGACVYVVCFAHCHLGPGELQFARAVESRYEGRQVALLDGGAERRNHLLPLANVRRRRFTAGHHVGVPEWAQEQEQEA